MKPKPPITLRAAVSLVLILAALSTSQAASGPVQPKLGPNISMSYDALELRTRQGLVEVSRQDATLIELPASVSEIINPSKSLDKLIKVDVLDNMVLISTDAVSGGGPLMVKMTDGSLAFFLIKIQPTGGTRYINVTYGDTGSSTANSRTISDLPSAVSNQDLGKLPLPGTLATPATAVSQTNTVSSSAGVAALPAARSTPTVRYDATRLEAGVVSVLYNITNQGGLVKLDKTKLSVKLDGNEVAYDLMQSATDLAAGSSGYGVIRLGSLPTKGQLELNWTLSGDRLFVSSAQIDLAKL